MAVTCPCSGSLKNSCPGDGGSGEQGAASSSSSKSGQLPSAGPGRVRRAAAAAAADCSIGAGTDRSCEKARMRGQTAHSSVFLPFNLPSSRFVCRRLGLLQFWPFPSSLVTANYEDPSTVSARLLPPPRQRTIRRRPYRNCATAAVSGTLTSAATWTYMTQAAVACLQRCGCTCTLVTAVTVQQLLLWPRSPRAACCWLLLTLALSSAKLSPGCLEYHPM